jgi:hypothetical protein
MTHLLGLIFVSAIVGGVFGLLMRESVKDRLLYAAKIFFGLVGFAFVAGWVIYFLPWG